MLRSVLKGTGLLIGTYLVLAYATEAGTLFSKGSAGGVSVIKALQARG